VGRPRLYCSGRCRQAACRRARAATALARAEALEPLGDEHGVLPASAHPDEQVAQAVLEARGLAAALRRLGREARPQLAWRCEGVGSALDQALARYFQEVL
jgi:hypothetical protein